MTGPKDTAELPYPVLASAILAVQPERVLRSGSKAQCLHALCPISAD